MGICRAQQRKSAVNQQFQNKLANRVIDPESTQHSLNIGRSRTLSLRLDQSLFALGSATAKHTPFSKGNELLDTSLAMATTHPQNAGHVPSTPTAFGQVSRVSVTPNEEDSVGEISSKRFRNTRVRPTTSHPDWNGNSMVADGLTTQG